MASQPPANAMPLMYNELRPLTSVEHATWKTRSTTDAPFLAKIHAVPILIDEFISAQRFFPIVFSLGDNPVPLALMGLNEGVNVFVDDKGVLLNPTYVPAYLRRYPFMLARLEEGGDSLSLCFDPTSNLVGEYDEGNSLFEDDKPSETTEGIMKFCEEFEIAAQRTSAFMEELKNTGLLIDGEVSIQLNDQSQPSVYRGFKMIDETKFRDMRGDELRKLNQNGMLPLMMAHLFSLPLSRELYLRQIEQGKGPQPVPAQVAEPAEA
jgi:hypothetical protein